MAELSRRGALGAAGAAGAAGLGLGGSGARAADGPAGGDEPPATTGDAPALDRDPPSVDGVVGTWACAHHPPVDGLSADGLADQTLRQVLHTSVGGTGVRLRLSNQFGEQPLRVGRAAVAVRKNRKSVVADTVTEVTFGGSAGVTVPPGARAYSDPADLALPADRDVVVDLYCPEPTGPLSWHNFGKDEAYITGGEKVGTGRRPFDTSPGEAYYLVDGLDVVAPDAGGTVVCLGDSITDGARSKPGSNRVYPTFLARRIADSPVVQKSVVNQGINGNRLLHNAPSHVRAYGPAGLTRLDRDVLSQTAVTDAVVLLGVNDLLHSQYESIAPNETITAEMLVDGLADLARRCHAAGVRFHGGTITPVGEAFQTAALEETRRAVNEWLRGTDLVDSVADFDAALRDPDDPSALAARYASEDGVHPSKQGYRAMARAVDLGALAGDPTPDPVEDGSGFRIDFGPATVTVDW